ncbi:hypothetical protein [Curtobacterium sp. VKM Ac-2922]|uniref:hypothetical protein n=1 Tax=Curtobacterium sp. VKM Ac-2922 TaxID=2929475 RepID=UPI001FB2AF10|nr:hypothetical protein [Curtobacterium sp. VKM Ac-2922]MCJ1715785.1 hypothetical protein [Curtobacterium sp. VKM Ac-2922]
MSGAVTPDLFVEACTLQRRAWVWMVAVTLPIVAFGFMLTPWRLLSRGDEDPVIRSVSDLAHAIPAAITWTIGIDLLTVPFSLVAALVALPFTGGLALALRRVRSRALHVVATSALAGTLAAVMVMPLLSPSALSTTIVLGAGAAAAVARHRELRRADRTAVAA